MDITLEPGMVFASSNPQGIGIPIRWMEKWWSKDRDAEYGHTGIIQDVSGKTLEALWSITEGNLFEEYAGSKVIIAKPLCVNDAGLINSRLAELKQSHLGQWYPAWRLPLFMIPPLARRISYKGKWVVCSELTAKYLYAVGARHKAFSGTNPDELVDEWRHWKNFEIVFEGVL